MTAEKLKAALRVYADATRPGWRCASIVVEDGPDSPAEVLVIRSAAFSARPGSLAALARNGHEEKVAGDRKQARIA
jgi:hypothetical protein